MTVRPTARLVFIALAIVLVFVVSFLRPGSPLSPEVRAPGHLPGASPTKDRNAKPGSLSVSAEALGGEVVMPNLGNETAKAELGRSAWHVLHTMMARFPDEPSTEQQETLRSFVYLFARLYPCGECASHFQSQLAHFPPQVSSRSSAAGWACHVHNEVNKMLHKDIFDCSKIGDFYDCGCADGHDQESKSSSSSTSSSGGGGGDQEENEQSQSLSDGDVKQGGEEAFTPAKVKINDEPLTNG